MKSKTENAQPEQCNKLERDILEINNITPFHMVINWMFITERINVGSTEVCVMKPAAVLIQEEGKEDPGQYSQIRVSIQSNKYSIGEMIFISDQIWICLKEKSQL